MGSRQQILESPADRRDCGTLRAEFAAGSAQSV